jgi:PAS domain S-box-containing protein
MLDSRSLGSQLTTDKKVPILENPIDSFKKWFTGIAIGHKIAIGYALSIGISVLGTTAGQIVSQNFIEAPALQKHEIAEQKASSLAILKDSLLNTKSDILPYLENPNLLNDYSYYLMDRAELADRSFLQLQATASAMEKKDPRIADLHTFLATHQATTRSYKYELKRVLKTLSSDRDATETISPESARERLFDFISSQEVLNLQKMEDDLDKLIEETRLEDREADAVKYQAETLRIQVMYASLVLSVAIAITFGYHTSSAIARPLQKLTQVSQQATQTSNFDLQIPVSSNDEVGILATSLNNLIRRVKQLLEEQQETKEQLEVRIEERTAQFQQKSSELEAILDAFPDLFFRHAADGTILNCQVGRQEHDLYLAPENFLGKRLVECLPPDLGEQLQEAIAQTVQTQSLNSIEYSLLMPTGEEYYEARFVPVGVDEVIGVIRNISDRKTAEIALRASEQKYQQILDAITDMVLVKGEKSSIVWANRSFRDYYNMTNQQLEDLIDTPFNDPDYTLQYINDDAYVFETGNTLEIEEPVTRYDGEIRLFSTIKSAIRNEEGKTILTVGVSRDISDRKAAEERLRQSEQQTQEKALELEATLKELQRTQIQMIHSEKMSSLGQMVAGVAHEINNPVSFVHGNLIHTQEYAKDLLHLVKLYQQHFPNPPEEIQADIDAIDLEFLSEDLEKTLKSMRVGTERIRDIVLSLRNFSRLDEAEFKEANLHEGIDNTLMILQNRLKANPKHPEIKVIKEYGKLPSIECCPGQLNQVFMNIFTNAIDALEESGIRNYESDKPATIAIHTEKTEDNWIEIRIADNGRGIPDDIRAKLFDPFFTTKPIGKGTGLGLSISYQIIVDRHGGKLSCHSEIGQGTEFRIEIPIQQYFGSRLAVS